MTDIGPDERVIRAMEKTARLYRFNDNYARLYGRLYFDGEMTLDELSEETGLSRSTVSRGMNRLEEMYLVDSRKKEGEGKTKFYRAEEDLEEACIKFMENEATREIEIMQEALEEAKEEMENQGDQEGLEKVRNLESFYSRSEKFLSLMKKMPRGKASEKVMKAMEKVIPGS